MSNGIFMGQGVQYPPANQGTYMAPAPDPYLQMMQFSQALLYDNYRLQEHVYSACNVISELEYKINRKTEKTPREFKKDSYTEVWSLIDRDKRKIEIGKLKLCSAVIVNMHEDLTFDALYCILNNGKGERPVVIPYKDLYRKDNKSLLQFFGWEPDCSPSHFINLFYYLLPKHENMKFLETPKESGWSQIEGNAPFFAASSAVDPVIGKYYPDDVKERKLIRTERALQDIAKEYADELPKSWKYKLLVTIRVASLLLYFFDQKGLEPKQMFVLKQSSESNAEAIISLLKTSNYEDIGTCSLTERVNSIQDELDRTNDGVALFRENSLIEEKKQLSKKIMPLVNDLQNATGKKKPSRHFIAIISKNPGNLPSDLPALYIPV